MKRQDYANSPEVMDIATLMCLGAEGKRIADTTKEKDWRRYLACAGGLIKKVVDERMACLSEKNLVKVDRKTDHMAVRVYTGDEAKRLQETNKSSVYKTLDLDDYYNLLDHALTECFRCSQGECVKDCEFRQTLIKLGVDAARTEVGPGECEYRRDNEVYSVDPTGKKIEGW